MDAESPAVGTAMKVSRFIASMKGDGLIRVVFVVVLALAFGVLTGYIPSPVVVMVEQQKELLDLSRLQLYLARENCKNGAKSEIATARCDRQEIRDAISDLPDESFRAIAAWK